MTMIMMAILRSRAEICITSTSILHLTSTSGSHADTREADHPHLFHGDLHCCHEVSHVQLCIHRGEKPCKYAMFWLFSFVRLQMCT